MFQKTISEAKKKHNKVKNLIDFDFNTYCIIKSLAVKKK